MWYNINVKKGEEVTKMITISEKDEATIIVIENPTGSELRVIEKAKEVQRALSKNVWAKFACNRKVTNEDESESRESLPDFMEEQNNVL